MPIVRVFAILAHSCCSRYLLCSAGTIVPSNQLWAGNPAVYVRDVTDEESVGIKKVIFKKSLSYMPRICKFGRRESKFNAVCKVVFSLTFLPCLFCYLQSAEHYAEVGRTHGEEFLPFGTTYQAAEAAKL